jgi:tetratricopeptide (TPR) repeat protein
VTYAAAAALLLNAGRTDEALTMSRRANELDSSAAFAHSIFALAIHAAGKIDSARLLIKGTGRVPQTSPWLGYLRAATGDRAGAAAYLDTLAAERGHNAFANVAQAWTYLGGGDTSDALAALERAARAREPVGFSVPFGMPAYNSIRHSPRFVAVIKAYGLDPANFGVTEKR